MNTVDADAVVGCDAVKAEQRLQLLFSQPRRLVVGPGRGRIHKQVRAVLGDERQVSGRTRVVNLRWDVPGPLSRCFPTLEARIAITAIDDITSLLVITGRYQPPMGAIGATADRWFMGAAARSTTRAAAHRLASTLADSPG